MNELVFLGTLIVLVIAGFLLARYITHKQTGRQRNHPVYHESSSKKHSHRSASHTLVHSHTSANRMHAADDIWRTQRLKANEAHWESGVVVANKILTDSELALEERQPEQEHGMSSIHYKPTGTSPRGQASKSAGKGRSRR
jgi:hypothetical protein